MTRLAWDMCRCMASGGCEVKEQCARHEQLNNMGPRTPVMDKCCNTPGYGAFIPIEAASKGGANDRN